MAHFFALSLAILGEMERSSEPLVQEFLKDDQQEFIFPTKRRNNDRGKEELVKVPRLKRRGD
jgi:hypothetical protein